MSPPESGPEQLALSTTCKTYRLAANLSHRESDARKAAADAAEKSVASRTFFAATSLKGMEFRIKGTQVFRCGSAFGARKAGMVRSHSKERRQTKASCECHRKLDKNPAAYPKYGDETTAQANGHESSPLESS